MEQRSTWRALNRVRSDRIPGDPADPLANVRSLADCLEEWAALRRCTSPDSPVAAEPQTAAGHTSTTIHEEPLPC